MTALSRAGKLRQNHSIWSAYTFGVAISTVDGRLTMIFSSGVAPHVSATAAQISPAKSSSVPVKLSGEYSPRENATLAPDSAESPSRTSFVPSTANLMMPSLPKPKTTRRCRVEVEL